MCGVWREGSLMSTEVITRENEIARSNDAPKSLLEVVYLASLDPRVDPEKMAAIFGFQERLEAREAEKQFNQAFTALKAELPRVVKDGKIRLVKDGVDKGSIPFATFEHIMAVVAPKLSKHGFTESYVSEEASSGVFVTLVLQHKEGHSRKATMRLPADPGPGRNNLQAHGSSLKYCYRYLITGMLGIVTVEKDDNGVSWGNVITEPQLANIEILMQESAADKSKFLETYGIVSLGELQAHQYAGAVAQLRAKIANRKAAK